MCLITCCVSNYTVSIGSFRLRRRLDTGKCGGMFPVNNGRTFIGYSHVTSFVPRSDLDTADYSDTLGQRIFLIFYLLFSTTFVANALGLLGSLTEELDETRKKYAWGRRNVSKALISEIQDNDDDNVDEYEFVLASLVQLGKASKDDITVSHGTVQPYFRICLDSFAHPTHISSLTLSLLVTLTSRKSWTSFELSPGARTPLAHPRL